MEYLLLFIAVLVIILLLLGLKMYVGKNKYKESPKKVLKNVHCPVCDSALYVGENIISKVYRPRNVPDQLINIYGCPHCFPNSQPNLTRTCPVCHKKLGQQECLIARLFNKKVGNDHVHILGCLNCRKTNS